MKFSIVILTALLTTNAYAGENHGGESYNHGSQNGSINNTVKTYNNNEQWQAQGQAQQNTSSVNVDGDHEARNPVSTAYAPSIAPTANCALSVSGGVQVMGLGASFGKAYVDENCAALEAVRSVSQTLGDKVTAEAMMCFQNEQYAKARAATGRPCPVEQQ